MEIEAHLNVIAAHYRRRSSWFALAIAALIMIYGGGAAMFWFHSILLGEGGPAISPVLHWFVDSTAGLFALTPVLFVLLPLADRYAGDGPRRARRFAFFSGGLFALATAPGPLLHDAFVSRGTWLANEVTRLRGDGRDLPPYNEIPAALNMTLQVAYGLPVYITLMWLTYLVLRQGERVAARSPSSPAGQPLLPADEPGSDAAGTGGPGAA